jgi:hypothetical protein
MLTALGAEIRQELRRYLAGELPIAEFTDWFIPILWDAAEGNNEAAADLAAHVDLLLIEYSNGDWTEDQLRDLLRPLAVDVSARS